MARATRSGAAAGASFARSMPIAMWNSVATTPGSTYVTAMPRLFSSRRSCPAAALIAAFARAVRAVVRKRDARDPRAEKDDWPRVISSCEALRERCAAARRRSVATALRSRHRSARAAGRMRRDRRCSRRCRAVRRPASRVATIRSGMPGAVTSPAKAAHLRRPRRESRVRPRRAVRLDGRRRARRNRRARRRIASARPIPELAPVTTIVLSVRHGSGSMPRIRAGYSSAVRRSALLRARSRRAAVRRPRAPHMRTRLARSRPA